MKKIKQYSILLVLFIALFIPSVEAKEINHFTAKADNTITLEDTYNSSVMAAGETVDINGKINGITFGAGDKVSLEGTTDYAFLAGNNIETKGTITKDAFVAGNIVESEEEATFQRDTIIAAATVKLNGTYERNLSIYASTVTLSNITVKGNVKIYAENIKIEKGTVIEGTLSYPEDAIYQSSKDAVIAQTIKTDPINEEDDETLMNTISGKFWSFLCLALVFAILCLIFPNIFDKITKKFEKDNFDEYVKSFAKGLVAIIIIPFISLMLIMTVIGLPLGIILLLIYGICIYLAKIFTAYLIGYKVWQKIFKKDAHILLFGIIGLFIILILELIPGVRILTSIIVTLLGLGLIIDTIKQGK